MKYLLVQLLLILNCTHLLCAGEAETHSVSGTNEFALVSQKLLLFERDKLGLDEVSGNLGDDEYFIRYYLQHSNDVTVKMKLPLSRCFLSTGRPKESAQLVQEYVNVYSNDFHGWRVLGAAKAAMQSFNEAIVALTNSVRLGDEENYVGLGLTALMAHRMDVLETWVVPKLLLLKDSEQTSRNERLEMVQILVAYSLEASKKDVFLRALKGVDPKTIIYTEDLRKAVSLGCDLFKGKEVEDIRRRISDASKKERELQ